MLTKGCKERNVNHPYKNGYSTLPQLKKITADEVFLPTPNLEWHMKEKKNALILTCPYVEFGMNDDIYDDVCRFISQHHPLKPQGGFLDIARHVPEDLVIHRMDDTKDWMAAGAVFFPSGWWPSNKIGKPLEKIHAPIPGMNLANSRKLVEAMVFSGPFERFVWSVLFENQINGHPWINKTQFDPKNPQVWVKVERQVTVGFPDHKAALFVLKHSLIPDAEIDKPELAKAIRGMTPEQKEYKGLADCHEAVVAYLDPTTSAP